MHPARSARFEVAGLQALYAMLCGMFAARPRVSSGLEASRSNLIHMSSTHGDGTGHMGSRLAWRGRDCEDI